MAPPPPPTTKYMGSLADNAGSSAANNLLPVPLDRVTGVASLYMGARIRSIGSAAVTTRASRFDSAPARCARTSPDRWAGNTPRYVRRVSSVKTGSTIASSTSSALSSRTNLSLRVSGQSACAAGLTISSMIGAPARAVSSGVAISQAGAAAAAGSATKHRQRYAASLIEAASGSRPRSLASNS